jgi:hypothetical protein
LRNLSAAYEKASAKLPAWALPGHRSIDQDGNPCDYICSWPLDENIPPPPLKAWRVVRPSIYDYQKSFDFDVRVFGATGKHRERHRAAMRRNILAIVARLRERKRLYDGLGITELNRQMEAATNAITIADEYFHECEDETPNIVAARIIIGLTNNCRQDATANRHGYCGTMAMALVALRGLLPNLSGLIREHAAFFVSNSSLSLSAMPFAPV